MKHRRLVSIISIALAMIIIAPRAVLAEEDTPADAPYQETIDEAVDAIIEPIDPALDEATPTLPSVHNSPMTASDPTLDPVVSTNNSIDIPVNSKSTPTTTPVASKNRVSPAALTVSLTMRSIQSSPIWSRH